MLRMIGLPAVPPVVLLFAGWVAAADKEGEKKEKPKRQPLAIAQDLRAQVPVAWKKQKPKGFGRIHQYLLPRAKDDPADGLLFIAHFGQGGGGSLEANLQRWYKMVEQPDDKSSEEVAETHVIETDGVKITWIDLPGTYLDKPFPFSRKVTRRETYRLFAAQIDGGQEAPYWLRAYGPNRTMLEHREAFQAFLRSVHVSR